jgi:hypothetical protein
VLVAAGGVLTEIERNRSLRLAGRSATANDIAEVRGSRRSPVSGKPAGDLDALARAIVALSQLGRRSGGRGSRNQPLIVRPAGEGVVAVDAVVRLA